MTASRASFPKTDRLRHAEEFRAVLKKAHSVREDGVELYVLENFAARKNRLGIVVSRRVFKHAVDRNRIKRTAREFFRLLKAQSLGNFDLVVRILSSDKILTSNKLREILTRLFKRAGVLANG